MSDFATWLFSLVLALFQPAWDFISDLFIALFEIVLLAISQTFSLIVVPCSMAVNSALSFNTQFSKVPSFVWYFAGHLDLSGCFKILSCAIIFVLVRKFATLFQW